MQTADGVVTLTKFLSDFVLPQKKALHKRILYLIFHIFRMILRLKKQKCT